MNKETKEIIIIIFGTTILLVIALGFIISTISNIERRKGLEYQNRTVVTQYGENIYYFDCQKDDFGQELGVWIMENDKDIVGIASNTKHLVGTVGYYVITKTTKEE